MKKRIRIFLCFMAILLIGVGALIAYLSVSEYRPEEVEEIAVDGEASDIPSKGRKMRIMTWNLGYGALGDNADFFMDGGRMVYTADIDRLYSNLDRMAEEISSVSPDLLLVQEIDLDSARSYFTDESMYLTDSCDAEVFKGQNAFATNFDVSFIPVPVPPIGKVLAGIEVFSRYRISSCDRIALPYPFKWPVSIANLKRCLEVTRIQVSESENELVVINLHLEAYDSGEGKILQTARLKEILESEVSKGNYVIAGGDFNQVFSNIDTTAFPVLDGMWRAGSIDVSEFGDDLLFLADSATATCRSLDRPLSTAGSREPSDFQYYVVDGFIVSSNINVESVHTEDLGFVCSDHNPVVMDFELK